MTAIEALDKMYHGSKVKCENGIVGNSSSVFQMNSAGIIIETFKISKRKINTEMFSYRRFLTMGADVEFKLV